MRNLIMIVLMFLFSAVCFGADVVPAATKLGVMEWVAIVAGCLFAISEVLAGIPAVNSNGIFQLLKSILKALVGGAKK